MVYGRVGETRRRQPRPENERAVRRSWKFFWGPRAHHAVGPIFLLLWMTRNGEHTKSGETMYTTYTFSFLVLYFSAQEQLLLAQ